jgi:FAD/FMN-containing dehydrogenase
VPPTVPWTDVESLSALADRARGALLLPGDDGYDDARRVWNARIDREPAAILRCRGAADVVAGIAAARADGLDLSVKSGGHHVSGSAVVSDGLVLDCSPMDGVTVDPDARIARVGPGATWGDVDAETQAVGLAVPGGQDPNIGVAGLTLGGGVGWLSPRFGLTCDNLRRAQVVTADGRVVHASADEHPDLFWALRGGGGGVGVVTEFAFDCHRVGPEILAGSLVYPFDDVGSVARYYREFCEEAPPSVRVLFGSMVLPSASYYPESIHGSRVAMIMACHPGPPREGRDVLAPLRDRGAPVVDSIRPRRYRDWQGAGASEGRRRTFLRSQYLSALSDTAVDTIVARLRDAPSAGATVFCSARRGAEVEPPTDATAYPHREETHHVLIEARWTDPSEDAAHVDWTRATHEALATETTGDAAVNFLTADERTSRRPAAFGENYDRLVAIEDRWDPENLFGRRG